MRAETGVLQEGTKNINANISAPVIIQEAPSNERYVESHTVVHKKGGFFGGVSSCFGGNSRKEIHHNSSAYNPKVCENRGCNFIADAYKKFKATGSKFLSKITNIKAGEEIEIKASTSVKQSQTNTVSNGLIWNKSSQRVEKHLIHSNPHFENNVNLYAPNIILEKVRGSSDTFKNIKSDTKPIIKKVDDKHEVVEKRQKSLTAGASILVKLAVGISMMYVSPVSGFMNLSGTTAVVTNAGFSSLCADASKSLIENNGDPAKATKDLSNKQTAINIGKSMISSGLVHEISNVVGVAPSKELTEYAKKAAITSAVNTVLSTSIDGQPLDKAIKEGLTTAIISTGSSYLAGQIGELKPEIGDVNHKILHGLLGGVSGGITASLLNKSFEDGAVSGALSGVVSEVMAGMLSPEIPRDLSNEEFKEEFIKKAERSAKWGEFTGTLSAFLAGHDAEVANQVASNAVENNFLPGFLIAITAAGTLYEGYQIYQTYEREGVEAALKHLGISVVAGVAGGVAVKAVFKVGKVVYPTLKEAYKAALVNKPILKSSLTKLEGKLGSIESGIHGKVSQNVAKVELPNISEPWKSKYWTESAEYTFKGQTNKVYKRNDLFDINFVDNKSGLTNLQLMKKGNAPIGLDKKPINLHHSLQTMDSPIVEIGQNMHQQYAKIIHINPNNIPSGIDRSAFKVWKKEYWIKRASELGGK